MLSFSEAAEKWCDLKRHFFSERIVNIWNKLDEDIVSAPTINSVKKQAE